MKNLKLNKGIAMFGVATSLFLTGCTNNDTHTHLECEAEDYSFIYDLAGTSKEDEKLVLEVENPNNKIEVVSYDFTTVDTIDDYMITFYVVSNTKKEYNSLKESLKEDGVSIDLDIKDALFISYSKPTGHPKESLLSYNELVNVYSNSGGLYEIIGASKRK